MRDADEILVLRNGVIVERGVHADLVKAGGEYERLLRSEEGEGALV